MYNSFADENTCCNPLHPEIVEWRIYIVISSYSCQTYPELHRSCLVIEDNKLIHALTESEKKYCAFGTVTHKKDFLSNLNFKNKDVM